MNTLNTRMTNLSLTGGEFGGEDWFSVGVLVEEDHQRHAADLR
jgi:hypothetical protein